MQILTYRTSIQAKTTKKQRPISNEKHKASIILTHPGSNVNIVYHCSFDVLLDKITASILIIIIFFVQTTMKLVLLFIRSDSCYDLS